MEKVNPPAFPNKIPQPHLGEDCFSYHPGMTLRDWFAGQALMGLVSGSAGYIGNRLESKDFSAYAKGPCNFAIVDRAYVLADAMLAER